MYKSPCSSCRFSLFGLWRYVVHTRGLKVAADKQIKLSRDLLLAAMDQAEGVARPCITLGSKRRDRDETMMGMHGLDGISVAKEYEGCFGFRNVGNGLALNVTYRFNQMDPNTPKDLPHNNGYLQRLHAGSTFRLPLPVSMAKNQHWEAVFEFESLGGRRYRTTLTLKANVLSDFHFEQISDPKCAISLASGVDNPSDKTE